MVEAIKVNPNTLSHELDLPVEKVEAAIALLESGYSVPFILRYRKDQTRLQDDNQFVKLAAAYEKQHKFADRKYSYLRTLEQREQLTPELEKLMLEARSPHRLDDLYVPFKSKSEPVPQAARDKGLEPLAKAIMNAADASVALEELAAPYVAPEKGVATVQDALAGAADIIAESFADVFELRQSVRGFILRTGKVVSKRAPEAAAEAAPAETAAEPAAEASESAEDDKKKGADDARAQQFAQLFAPYFDASFDLRRLTRDQTQALNRGLNAKILEVSVEVDHDRLVELAKETVLPADRPYAEYLESALVAALDLYLVPALTTEARRERVDDALEQAVANVCSALYNKMMQRPLPGRRILAVDSAFRNTCRVVAMDETGAVLETASVYVRGAEERLDASVATIVDLVTRHNLSVIALRAGSNRAKTADSFFAKIVSENLADKEVVYISVNDVGLDSYSTSALAAQELPELDSATRAVVALGRRLLNPLTEYVKVSPEFLCDDPFCRKLRAKTLRDLLGRVVARCVNRVGADVNAASAETLSFISGLTPLAVTNLIEYRKANGAFRNREQFKEVDGVSDATYAQCAGFLRIVDGDNPLDATWIHPESYAAATALLEKFGFTVEDLRSADKRAELDAKLKDANMDDLAAELGVGPLLCADLASELVNPGKDVREEQPYPIFKRAMIKLEDLKEGMELTGVVSRVVDYGAFVDFGGVTTGMVHVSRLAASHVHDARQAVAVGDMIKVWVVEVSVERGRVGFTAVDPSAPRERRPRRDSNNANGGSRRPARGESSANADAADKRERRPRRPRQEGDAAENKSAERRPRSERSERSDRGPRRPREDRDRAPRSAQVAPKEKTLAPLSEEKKSGKESLNSFSELKQFFNL